MSDARGVASKAALCVGFVVLEVLKQMLTFGAVQEMAVDGGLVVVAAEVVKLAFATAMALCDRTYTLAQWRAHLSLLFAAPAILFAVNSNIYMFAMRIAAPPVWAVLIQGRVLLTAVVYRAVFRRPVTLLQWGALCALSVGVALSQMKPDLSDTYVTPMAAVLAVVACAVSVASSLSIELLFKHHACPFQLQQAQLYLHGTVTAGAVWWAVTPSGTPSTAIATFVALSHWHKVSLCVFKILSLCSLSLHAACSPDAVDAPVWHRGCDRGRRTVCCRHCQAPRQHCEDILCRDRVRGRGRGHERRVSGRLRAGRPVHGRHGAGHCVRRGLCPALAHPTAALKARSGGCLAELQELCFKAM